MSDIKHYDLCKITAERFIKENHIGVFEYPISAIEQPDVLLFKNGVSTLFEIKVSRSDFLSDKKKESRIKYKLPHYFQAFRISDKFTKVQIKKRGLKRELIEYPHLGRYRYYVCPSKLINVEDLPDGWGLYWYKSGRFYLKRKSEPFKNDVHAEMNILTHVFRKFLNHMNIEKNVVDNFIYNKYDNPYGMKTEKVKSFSEYLKMIKGE